MVGDLPEVPPSELPALKIFDIPEELMAEATPPTVDLETCPGCGTRCRGGRPGTAAAATRPRADESKEDDAQFSVLEQAPKNDYGANPRRAQWQRRW